MLDFMKSGGALMWPLLSLGCTSLVLAVRRAFDGGDAYVPRQLACACLAGSLAWSLLGSVMVTRAAEQPDGAFAMDRILTVGAGEALCLAVLGLAQFALVQLALAVRTTTRLSATAP